MYWQYTPYVTWLLAAALIAALLAGYGWQRRRVSDARPFVGLMLAAVAWSLA